MIVLRKLNKIVCSNFEVAYKVYDLISNYYIFIGKRMIQVTADDRESHKTSFDPIKIVRNQKIIKIRDSLSALPLLA